MWKSAILLLAAGCSARMPPGTPEGMAFVSGGGLRPVWIAERAVTWEEFDRYYESVEDEKADGVTRPSRGKGYLALGGVPNELLEAQRPVTNIRIHSAQGYCEWLSRKSGGYYRLPTEKEWQGGGDWEYCLEPAAPPAFGPVLRGASGRQRILEEWVEADPARPLSSWWLRGGRSQGFRIVLVTADPGRHAYAAKIEIGALAGVEHRIKIGPYASIYHRVTGTVRNGGDRSLDELALKVFRLETDGKPHLADSSTGHIRHATHNTVHPVLVNSAHPGDHAKPLGPGESRAFAVDVPFSFDELGDVRFGASVVDLAFPP